MNYSNIALINVVVTSVLCIHSFSRVSIGSNTLRVVILYIHVCVKSNSTPRACINPLTTHTSFLGTIFLTSSGFFQKTHREYVFPVLWCFLKFLDPQIFDTMHLCFACFCPMHPFFGISCCLFIGSWNWTLTLNRFRDLFVLAGSDTAYFRFFFPLIQWDGIFNRR